MSDQKPIVEFRNVSFHYGSNPAVVDVTFDIFPDDFLAIVGPTGGGKTTILKLMLGMLRPDSGTLTLFGKTPREARTRIGYVPQRTEFDGNFPVTVEEIVLTGRLGYNRIGRRYSEADREAARRAMDELDLARLAHREIGALSGGERQRTLVARALSCEPDMLVLDEPTSSVDSRIEKSFYELLQTLHKRIPIVLVSHDLGFVSAYVTRVACINRRLVVNPVGEMHAHDLEALYEGPVRMWSHNCNL